jgi:hypothetical protein
MYYLFLSNNLKIAFNSGFNLLNTQKYSNIKESNKCFIKFLKRVTLQYLTGLHRNDTLLTSNIGLFQFTWQTTSFVRSLRRLKQIELITITSPGLIVYLSVFPYLTTRDQLNIFSWHFIGLLGALRKFANTFQCCVIYEQDTLREDLRDFLHASRA